MQTSPTGKLANGAFTLLEMMVVLAIIGGLIAMAVPAYSKMTSRLLILSASHEVLLDLRHAHSEAISARKAITITFQPSHNAYTLGNKERILPVGISITSDLALSEQNPVLRFYPDGSADPYLITLSDHELLSNIHINGITGEVISDEN